MPQIVGIASAVTPAEGEDYLLEDGEAPALTEAGWVRMGRAHAAGREAVIEVDEIVIFRYPAPSPQTLAEREREDAAAEAPSYPDS